MKRLIVLVILASCFGLLNAGCPCHQPKPKPPATRPCPCHQPKPQPKQEKGCPCHHPKPQPKPVQQPASK